VSRRRTVAIYVFDDVEVLDFAGPFEVFSVAGRRQGLDPFDVFTVAKEAGPVTARNGLSLNPAWHFGSAPPIDLLVIPGGYGSRAAMADPDVLRWVGERGRASELLLSICTGSLILARAGLLDGLAATTHHGAIEELREAAPRTRVEIDARVVDNGHVITAAGVSSGIDMSLHVVERLLGRDAAEETARYIEYPWPREGVEVST
jgi:transcriptional regulator GlxA family with amidase domain